LPAALLSHRIWFSLKNQWFDQNWRIFFTTGICGGSQHSQLFQLKVYQLLQQQRYGAFTAYIALSIMQACGGFCRPLATTI